MRFVRCIPSAWAFVFVVAALLGPMTAARASQLLVDGQTGVTKTLGETVVINLSGAAGKPAYLFVDIAPGPTTVLNHSLPIGFSPAFTLVPLGVIGSNGHLLASAKLPNLEDLDGVTLYLVGLVVNGAPPVVLAFSNGATITLSKQPVIHGTQSTIVGRKVILDASAYANPDGSLLPLTSVTWSIVSAPASSTAAIADANKPYATLTPDRTGDYLVRATIVTPTFLSQQSATIHAYQVTTSPFTDGGISFLPSFNLTGTILGPSFSSVTLDGAPLAVAANGAFGPVPTNITDGVKTSRTFVITASDGSVAVFRATILAGVPQPLIGTSPKSLVAQINGPAIDQIEVLGENALKAADIKGLLLGLPPQQIANDTGPFGITLFSATIDFTNLTYGSNLDLQLVPTATGIPSTVTIHNVRADFVVYGEIVNVDYSLSGYITSDPTIIDANLVGSAQSGQIHVAVNNVVVDRQNFHFTLNGFLGSVAQLFIIESSVEQQVESTIAQAVSSQLPSAIASILNTFSLSGSLFGLLGVDVSLAAPVTGVVHSNFGLAIQLDGKATVGNPEPGSPVVGAYRGTPSTPVVFNSTTPTGQSYGAALAVGDDFVNQVLAAATGAGLLDGDLTSLFPSSGGGGVSLTTDQLAILFPDSGFDRFAVGTPVKLRSHGTVPPVLVFTPLGPKKAKVYLENVEVEFEVALPYSANSKAPLLLVSLRGNADVDLTQALDGTLNAIVGSSTLAIDLLRPFPGADYSTIAGQTQFLGAAFNFALPEIISALGQIPLPSLAAAGLSLQPTQVHLIGNPQQNLGLYGNLVVTP